MSVFERTGEGQEGSLYVLARNEAMNPDEPNAKKSFAVGSDSGDPSTPRSSPCPGSSHRAADPLDGIAERIGRLRTLEAELGRGHAPLEFGLRITTFVRDTTEQAWADAEAKVAQLAAQANHEQPGGRPWGRASAVGQRRLLDLAERGDVLDDILYTAPSRAGGGGAATTWLVGTAQEVAAALRKYERLGVTHFVLSDTPYLPEIERQGRELVPLLRH